MLGPAPGDAAIVAQQAQRLGARIEEKTEVADGQLFVAEQLLITAGAWAARLSERFGEPVPLEPNGGISQFARVTQAIGQVAQPAREIQQIIPCSVE